MFRITEVCNGS